MGTACKRFIKHRRYILNASIILVPKRVYCISSYPLHGQQEKWEVETSTRGKNLRPALRPVPHSREWRQTQDRPQLVGILGQKDWSGARFRLLRSQHQEGR